MQKKVYLEQVGPGYAAMFMNNGWKVVQNPEDADVICFTGGADVAPMLYMQPRHPKTSMDLVRDERCTNLFLEFEGEKKFVGICRGAQFLNVMNGGSLYQHVDGHATGQGHEVVDVESGESFHVSSTHHQMMIPTSEADLLLYAEVATIKEPDMLGIDIYDDWDIEAVFYEETQSLCFQPHPEYFSSDDICQQYFFAAIDDCIEGF